MSAKRLFFAALLLLAAACQAERSPKGILVSLTVADDAHRPEFVLLSWLAPGASVPSEHRFPDSGSVRATGVTLGTALFATDKSRPGERLVVARGMRAEGLVSMAAARIAEGVAAVTLTLGPPLPDSDGDGLPDLVDDGAADPRDGGPPSPLDTSPEVPPDLAPPREPNGEPCSTGERCSSGFCVDGVCCASACTEICFACNLAGAQGSCSPVASGEDPANDCQTSPASTCGSDGVCDGRGQCRVHAEGTRCSSATCATNSYAPPRTCDGLGTCRPAMNTTCGGYLCASAEACQTTCSSNAQCFPPNVCVDGACSGPRPLGAACTSGAECVSGECHQGVCCGSACAKPCYSCAIAGRQGSCIPIPDGADPLDQCANAGAAGCGTDGFCNGMGACRLHAGATVCAPGSCAGSTLTMARTCNGSGTCRPPIMLTCAPYACGGTECRKSCTKDSECAAGAYCTAGACVPRKGNGQACGGAPECLSGFCSRGVCCDVACTGACQSCVLPGAQGGCRPVPDGQDPHDQCAATAPTSCGTDGFCNGNSACRFWRAGTTCAAGTCSGTTAVPERTCSGSGTCVSAQPLSCGKYPCAGTACATSCVSSADCVAPSVCAMGGCGGLRGEYFDAMNLTAPVGARVDPQIDFDWLEGAPFTGVEADSFSIRWTGKVTPQFSERYTFVAGSDDGLRLWVNGTLVVDNWDANAYEEREGSIALTAGRAHDIKVEYFDNSGNARVKLMWESPSQPRAVVPASALTPP